MTKKKKNSKTALSKIPNTARNQVGFAYVSELLELGRDDGLVDVVAEVADEDGAAVPGHGLLRQRDAAPQQQRVLFTNYESITVSCLGRAKFE